MLKARTALGRSMGAAVVGRNDLEVFDLPATIPVLVLDADIGKLNVLVLVRQPVVQGPFSNLVGRTIGSAVAVPLLTIALLEETLIVTLQLIVEDYASNMATAVRDLGCRVLVGAVKVGIVCDLWSPGDACVEALAILERAVLRRIQQVATTLRERHEGAPGTSCTEGARLDQARAPQVFNLPIATLASTTFGRLEVTSRHRAKRPDRRH
ncbi:MAG TPA: hypothetical protein VMS40_25810 [Vicinamibacterales bacterium]|nr:hypothetical protein [Vicinamibacterales bacterium]